MPCSGIGLATAVTLKTDAVERGERISPQAEEQANITHLQPKGAAVAMVTFYPDKIVSFCTIIAGTQPAAYYRGALS
jgi:hypothetical protein